MLKEKFSEIELRINRLLVKVLNKLIPEQIEYQDTSGLIQMFINNYSKICEEMNWNERDKEPFNKVHSIRAMRNKYYHYKEGDQKYSEKQETLDILNILTFFELFDELLKSDEEYIMFIKNLTGLYFMSIGNTNKIDDSYNFDEEYERTKNLVNEGRYLDYKTAIDNDILIWEITVDENPDFDGHVRIVDSIIENLDGASCLCHYFKDNYPKSCFFCPLGPDCKYYLEWKNAIDEEDRLEAAKRMLEKLEQIKIGIYKGE